MTITMIYVIAGGMYSVVITDLLQFTILAIASVFIGYIAMVKISPEMVTAMVPDGWHNLFFGWKLNMDWSGLIPSVNARIATDGWSLFTIVFMMMLFKGVLISIAGPAPNYDMQRILAARKPKEAAFMSGVVSVCLFPRWLMITGITLLAIVFYSPNLIAMGPDIDFEMILPYVINNFIPVGLVGFLIAGLLAAFMSTFDATVNAGASYIVNDIYKRYINPGGTDKQFVRMSYVASVMVVIVGMIAGLMAESINTAMQWIVSGLWGGYTAPNILKWHWWRFNGFGYFWGMISGLIAASVIPILFPELSALNSFPVILLVSAASSIIASYRSKPEEEEVLKRFYMSVRPWGLWGPVCKKVEAQYPDFKKNTHFKRDALNIAVGIVWQMTLVLIPVYLVLESYTNVFITTGLLVLTSMFLKFNWMNKLEAA